MSTLPIRLPAGVRDFLPRAAARRRALADAVMRVFEAWGYARIITPMFEHADVLERGLGAGARAAAIRFVEPGTGEVVVLRPDITPQIARVVATRMAEVPGPIRLAYEGAVVRRAPGDGGQREILQAGIELCDAPEPDGDAEVIAVAAAALEAIELPDVRLDVGHVAPAAHVLGAAPDAAARAALVGALARKDRAGVRAAAAALPEAVRPLAEALATLWGPAPATLQRAAALPWPAPVAAAIARLAEVIAAADELAAHALPVTIDLGDVRGFDYYTGVRFAAFAPGAPDAVLRGGRYDELLGRYGRAAADSHPSRTTHPARDRPATGFAIDLEAVAQAQRTTGVAPPAAAPGVATHGPGAAALARALRAAGLRAVAQRRAPEAWGPWLAAAGLDAAITGDVLIGPDGARRDAAAAIEAAAKGDTQALIALLRD